MSSKLIVSNWKMNPRSLKEAHRIITEINKKFRESNSSRLVVCPPYIFLTEVSKIISSNKNIILGAQDVYVGEGVSHTGEIGLDLVKNVGVKYVLVGHSERRGILDTDEVIKQKTREALKADLKVILCVGEKERDSHGNYYHEIERELESALSKLPKKLIRNLIIAYEPVWAIGKSEKEAIKPEQLYEMNIFIKRVLSDLLGIKEVSKVKILYGGSVTKNNFKEILEKGNVDGLLVGRESLKVKEFLELINEVK